MTKEEFKELWENDELERVHEELDSSYRHGNYVNTIFKATDGTFWEASYTVSGNGEEHGIRDNNFSLGQVRPVTETVIITKYVYI